MKHLQSLLLFATLLVGPSAEAALGNVLDLPERFSVGAYHSCAIVGPAGSAVLKCWGANDFGQLGIGTITPVPNPNPLTVATLSSPNQVSAGWHNTCAITGPSGARLFCWGHGINGGNGIGTTIDHSTPQWVNVGGGIPLQVSVGTHFACAIASFNTQKKLYCWGHNNYGQLGNGNLVNQLTPVLVNLGPGAQPLQVNAGDTHACVVVSAPGLPNHIKCWGRNYLGQLGTGNTTNQNTPQTVNIGAGMVAFQIAAGGSHTCAVMAPLGGTPLLKCWGSDAFGQLGIGGSTAQTTPQFVLNNAENVEAGHLHTCVQTLKTSISPQIKCWGNNNIFGSVGVGTLIASYNTPQLVNLVGGLMPVRISTNGGRQTCAQASPSAGVWHLQCWGHNIYGQLGNGGTANATSAVVVP